MSTTLCVSYLENALKILRNEKECPASLKIIGWVKASFEPIAKGWLRNFYLVIRDRENTQTIETYTFKFHYTEADIHTEIYRYVIRTLVTRLYRSAHGNELITQE